MKNIKEKSCEKELYKKQKVLFTVWSLDTCNTQICGCIVQLVQLLKFKDGETFIHSLFLFKGAESCSDVGINRYFKQSDCKHQVWVVHSSLIEWTLSFSYSSWSHKSSQTCFTSCFYCAWRTNDLTSSPCDYVPWPVASFQVVAFVSVRSHRCSAPAVITASPRPNVVIVTYIPGKYAACLSNRVRSIWPSCPFTCTAAAFAPQNKTPPLLALPKLWPLTPRLCLRTA